ncbi:hypothetical protein [Stenomitos frigidus]|uniref:Uncharacterized protein n=1 Tax=Stenomitos frigidus ULC18 TaxID=2107698 RepID=A0A2T1E1R5_9CYAN|nr:hypothetical protein [Stenomitos frigidus]PSB26650.1 hypothetical protein C7B82_19285 [Stenomitos frigidus ULC18]
MPKPLISNDFDPIAPALRVVPGNLREIPANVARNSRNASAKWGSPKSSREIAEMLVPNPETANSVENFRRNVANWYPVIRQAYCWMPEQELRIGSGKGTRYTPFCCEQMEALMNATAQGSYGDWIASVHQDHAEDYATYQAQAVQAAEPVQTPVQPAITALDGELIDTVSTVPASTIPASQLVTFNETSYRVGGSLVNVNVGALNITVQAADASPIQAQTQFYEDLAAQAASVLNQGFTAEAQAEYVEAKAQVGNAIAGMKANALLNLVRQQQTEPAPGKPSESENSGSVS